MWIVTTSGLWSAVQHRDKPHYIIVRARAREHLKPFEPHAIVCLDEADYRYRVTVRREKFRAIVNAEIDAIRYPNFKNEVARRAHPHNQAAILFLDFLSDVWRAGYRMQQLIERAKGRRRVGETREIGS
jgi:hypothetical protein